MDRKNMETLCFGMGLKSKENVPGVHFLCGGGCWVLKILEEEICMNCFCFFCCQSCSISPYLASHLYLLSCCCCCVSHCAKWQDSLLTLARHSCGSLKIMSNPRAFCTPLSQVSPISHTLCSVLSFSDIFSLTSATF